MPHLLLYLVRHIDQSEPIEHPINVSHSPDIAQCLWPIYHHFSFYIAQRQKHRTPRQTFALLPSVYPQLLRVLAVPAFFNFIKKMATRSKFWISHRHKPEPTPEVFFCRISPPPLHRSVSPLPLCTDIDFLFFCCTWEVHTFLIWQVRTVIFFGNKCPYFGMFNSVSKNFVCFSVRKVCRFYIFL